MTGILAQTIAMVSFGNEYLEKKQLNNFYPDNSVFQYCNSIDFREMKKSNFFSTKKEIIVAKNPIEWFNFLSQEKCKKLKLYYQSQEKDDHRLAAFVGGGGNWFIECVYQDYSDFWISNWTHDKNSKTIPWNIIYGKALSKQPTINYMGNLTSVRNELKTCLEKISDFAFKETTENWGKIFEEASKMLESKNPEMNFYNEMVIRDNYNLESLQLLISANKAFVFGGMGSWNDMVFQNEELDKEYNLLSSQLYKTMMESFMVAVNNDKL